jgi:signal recognition particle subunit SRP54
LLKGKGRRPLLVAADLERPAAVEQLRTLGREIGVPVFSEGRDPVKVAKAGLKEAERQQATWSSSTRPAGSTWTPT